MNAFIRIEVYTAVEIYIVVFGTVTPCSLLDGLEGVDLLGGIYCLLDDRGRLFIQHVGTHLSDYTVS
jgi:hypothetical protein